MLLLFGLETVFKLSLGSYILITMNDSYFILKYLRHISYSYNKFNYSKSSANTAKINLFTAKFLQSKSNQSSPVSINLLSRYF